MGDRCSKNEDGEPDIVPRECVFVVADDGLQLFPSIKAAEAYIEASDVLNGVYPAAYGPEGESYQVGTDGVGGFITPTGEPNKPHELKALLLHHFETIEEPNSVDDDLTTLVRRYWLREKAFLAERDPYGERFAAHLPLWGCIAIIVVMAGIVYMLLR